MFNHTCSFIRYLDSIKHNLQLLYIHAVSQTTVNLWRMECANLNVHARCSELIMFND